MPFYLNHPGWPCSAAAECPSISAAARLADSQCSLRSGMPHRALAGLLPTCCCREPRVPRAAEELTNAKMRPLLLRPSLSGKCSIARTPLRERGKKMDAPTTEAAAAKDTSNGVEQQRLPEQKTRQRMELDAEKIRSSIARLSSSSVGELEGLASELRKLDEFLKTETSYIQREIEGALAGIKIITEAISPWRLPVPTMPRVGSFATDRRFST